MFSLKEIVEKIKNADLLYYVYCLHKVDGTVFYVGKGTSRKIKDERISYHEYEARLEIPPVSNPYCNMFKVNTIRKIWREGHEVLYSIDSWHEVEYSAFERERQLIANIGRKLLGQGTLTNITEGGDGASPAEETKQKISASLKKYYQDHPEKRQSLIDQGSRYFADPLSVDKARLNAIRNKSHENIIKWLEKVPDDVFNEKMRQHSEDMKKWHVENRERYLEISAKRNEGFRTEEHRNHMAEATRNFIKNNPEADKARRNKVKASFDMKAALRQKCLQMIYDMLIKSGKIKTDKVKPTKISNKRVSDWKSSGIIPECIDLPSGYDKITKWQQLYDQLLSFNGQKS